MSRRPVNVMGITTPEENRTPVPPVRLIHSLSGPRTETPSCVASSIALRKHCIPHFDDVVERRAVSFSTFLIQAVGKPVYRGRPGAKTITRGIDDAIVNEACRGRLARTHSSEHICMI